MMRRSHLLIWVATGVSLLPGDLLALGERQNVRGVGMGRTYTAVSYGLDAAGLNPANLDLEADSWLTIGIAPAGFHAGGDVLTYGVYTNFFSGIESPNGLEGRFLEEAEKGLIMDGFDGQQFGSSFADVDARLLGVAVRLPHTGVLAFTVTDYAGAVLTFPDDLAQFILYGNPLGSSYDFQGTDLSAEWIRAYTLSFGSKIPGVSFFDWLAIGGGVKLVHGYAYYEVLRSDSRLETSDYGILTGTADFLARVSESSTLKATGFDLFPEPAGLGFGFDVGVSAGLTKALSVGMSVTDIGSVSWTANTEEVFSDTTLMIDNPLDPVQQEAILDAISGSGRREGAAFSTKLPTRIHFGIALTANQLPMFEELAGELVLGFDYLQSVHDGPGSSESPRFSFGAEYIPVDWLPLRGGISSGGATGTAVAAGFGIRAGFLSLDFATDNVGWIVAPSKMSYGSFSVGAAVRL